MPPIQIYTQQSSFHLLYKMADMHGTQLETAVLLKNTAMLDLNPPRGICCKGLWPCHSSPHVPPDGGEDRALSAKLWKGKGEFLVPLT